MYSDCVIDKQGRGRGRGRERERGESHTAKSSGWNQTPGFQQSMRSCVFERGSEFAMTVMCSGPVLSQSCTYYCCCLCMVKKTCEIKYMNVSKTYCFTVCPFALSAKCV